MVYDRLENSVSKYVHELKYYSIADEIWAVVDVVLIFNFIAEQFSNFGKFKIITTSTMAYILSSFELYSNWCTYLETELSDLSYTKFSDQLDDHNLSKTHGVVIYETYYVIPIGNLNNRIHT